MLLDLKRFAARALGALCPSALLPITYGSRRGTVVAARLIVRTLFRVDAHGGGDGGQRRPGFCIDGSEQTTRYCEQRGQGRTPERDRARVDERGSARRGAQRRCGEPSSEVGAASSRRACAGRRRSKRRRGDDKRHRLRRVAVTRGPSIGAGALGCWSAFGLAIIGVSCPSSAPTLVLGGRPTVGHVALDHGIGVRIPASQPIL